MAEHLAFPSTPVPLTSFVGREREVAAVCELLREQDARLVTLTGPGGVGKTRLALRVAEEAASVFSEGVWFVPLAPVREPAFVAAAIAQTLGVREVGPGGIIGGIVELLKNRSALLILDNFEHVVEACPIVTHMMASCERLRCLVTSRAVLRLVGEHVFPVPPLPLAPVAQRTSAERAGRSHAVRLFVTRAQATQPEFDLTDANAADVETICRRLDGVPLAIELAAARVRHLALSELAARLAEPEAAALRLLTVGPRDAPTRQRTMRDTIAWSYALLSPAEQVLFRRLTIFVGGFTLQAARAVCEEVDELDVLEEIAALIDSSLLRQEMDVSPARYVMLETIREFGLERLAERGEEAATRRAYVDYYLALAEKAALKYGSPSEATWLGQLQPELPNLRAVLGWSTEQQDAEALLRLTVALWWVWWGLESSTDGLGCMEGLGWLERAVAATTQIPPVLRGLRAHLLAVTGRSLIFRGDYLRAATLLEGSLSLAEEAGEEAALAHAELGLGHLAIAHGDLTRAELFSTKALARWREMAEPNWTGEALSLLAYVASVRSEHAEAETLLTEALEVGRAHGAIHSEAGILEALGTCAREQGDDRRAADYFVQSLTLAHARGDPLVVALCIKSLGAVAVAVGKAEQAVRLFGAAESFRERVGLVPEPIERTRLEQVVAPARACLPRTTFAASWATGRSLPVDQAIAEAFALADAVASQRPSKPAALDGLSRRELEVLHLLVAGKTDQEIGEALFISRRTASKHVGTILAKLEVNSRAEAAVRAVQRSLA